MAMKKTRRQRRLPVITPPIKKDEERPLTGFVMGKAASDIEEVYARALRSAGYTFVFDFALKTKLSTPGRKNQIDFLVNISEVWHAIEIDGEFAHKTNSKKLQDQQRDIFVNEQLKKENIKPIQRVMYTDLMSQNQANSFVRRQF